MYTKVNRLSDLVNRLQSALVVTKKTTATAEQVMKAEDIVVQEGGTLNITQHQYIIIHQADSWIDEMKILISVLQTVIPDPNRISFPLAIRTFKKELITNALEEEDWHYSKAAKRLGITERSVRYYSKEEQ